MLEHSSGISQRSNSDLKKIAGDVQRHRLRLYWSQRSPSLCRATFSTCWWMRWTDLRAMLYNCMCNSLAASCWLVCVCYIVPRALILVHLIELQMDQLPVRYNLLIKRYTTVCWFLFPFYVRRRGEGTVPEQVHNFPFKRCTVFTLSSIWETSDEANQSILDSHNLTQGATDSMKHKGKGLSFCSWNARGVTGQTKRGKVLSYLKTMSTDVIFLQKTHLKIVCIFYLDLGGLGRYITFCLIPRPKVLQYL